MTCFKSVFRLCLLFALLASSACSNSEGKGRELYETAQFEETQSNLKHARQLYQDILADYPQSSFAPKAKERLSALNAEAEEPQQELK